MDTKNEIGADKKVLAKAYEYVSGADATDLKTDRRVLINIIKALDEKGISPTALAGMLGYSESMGGFILKGKRGLTVNTLLRIAEILEVDPASLLPEDMRRTNKVSFEKYVKEIVEETIKDKYLKKE